jgi:hypothetical protein
MPVQSWEELNRRIVQENLRWREVQEQLLNILVELDRLRREDRIPEGRYRQKGNYFRDTIIALIEASCGFKLYEQELPGKTDRHRVDISYLQNYENPRQGFVLLAGEVKAMGSPEHEREGKRYPERTLTIDIDKRIKEVKYTSIDLKRLADPTVSRGWYRFIRETPPAFFTAWLLRLAAQDRLEHVFEKLKGISEYTNGVGVAIYREWSAGQYEWIEKVPDPLLTIGEFIELICRFLQAACMT